MKSNDPISKYCFKKLKNDEVHVALEVLNDFLEELAGLCKIFQRQGLTPIAHAKINKIPQKYLGDTTFWSERVDNLLARTSNEKTATFNTERLLNFIGLLCDHMVERFLEGEMKDWVAFDCAALKFLS